jgi:uncharacterized protein YydD (DUF2326 family)
MRLSELLIKRGDVEIRSIKFKSGLNLILDKPAIAKTKSGNSVGKTTVLRLIDFCLGSDGDDIWEDSEFKGIKNQEVYGFLNGSIPVSISLKIEDANRGAHTLHRSFNGGSDGGPTFQIDATRYPQGKSYKGALKQMLFGVSGDKPSLRQLVPKFVRSSPKLMSKTLRYLGDYGSTADYEALHLFLFGFFAVETLEKRLHLTAQKKKLDRDWEVLNRLRGEEEIKQLLIHLRREIEEIGLSPEIHGEVPEIAARATVVTEIRSKAANVVGDLSRLDAEIASLRMTIRELKNEYSDVDRKAIEAIYREAQSYIPKLHHDWSDLVDFIQNLRGRKERFLEAQITELAHDAELEKAQLSKLQQEERKEIGALVESPEFAKALELRADLQEKLKRLGSLEQDQNDLKELKDRIAIVDRQMSETPEKVESEKSALTDRLSTFNKYFSQLSKTLYGEQYLLTFEESTNGSLSFKLAAVGANVGSGKKASQTAAFDLAYIDFLHEAKINFPYFVCHDGMEQTHANQMTALLDEASKIDGQLILATLRDKLPNMPKDFIEQNTVLELAQEDKLFRINS